MTDECRVIVDYLNCDYELMKSENNASKIIARFNELRLQGKEDGFYPLIVLPDDTLAEYLTYCFEKSGFDNTADGVVVYRQSIIDAAASIDAESFLQTALDEYLGHYNVDDAIWGQDADTAGEPRNELSLYMLSYGQYEEVIIAKIPTQKPWELAAWIPMGGWNDCPSPVEQVAVFRYWHEKYKAVPAVVSHDVWEMTLTAPPLTEEKALALAKEHFAFDPEYEMIRGLASSLKSSTIWFFWWD